jgi:hypothetical protein
VQRRSLLVTLAKSRNNPDSTLLAGSPEAVMQDKLIATGSRSTTL